jgi:hypothetical protein
MSMGKTSITIPVDLEGVTVLRPDGSWGFMAAAVDACEVYVVTRIKDDVRVHAFVVSADELSISAVNRA